jgi:hypothetical protein
MTKQPSEPLRGNAAWQAERQRISQRNDAAQARGREERAVRDEAVASRRREAERHERENLPTQPQRPAG